MYVKRITDSPSKFIQCEWSKHNISFHTFHRSLKYSKCIPFEKCMTLIKSLSTAEI